MAVREADRTTDYFGLLEGHQYMNLTTFRKNGEGVPTPVWFAREGDTLFVMTQAESYKVRRLRNNPRCTVQPCDVRGNPLDGGPTAEAQAVIHENGSARGKHANRALTRKYHVLFLAFKVAGAIGGRPVVYLEVTPPADA